jgi:hypothetical protein
MGMGVAVDCELGLTLSHGGGYPGYGSHVLILPDFGIGIFALANRTYAGPRAPVWDAAVALLRAGLLVERSAAVGPELAAAYAAVGAMYRAGAVTAAGDVLAMNFLLDRSAELWARDLAELKVESGDCETTSALVPTGVLSGEFTWLCAHGRVKGSVLLSPTSEPRIQALALVRAEP